MKEYILSKSTRKDKKFMLSPKGEGKTIHFGASGYSDFTKHGDEARKNRYIQRHKSNEDWDKVNAGSASRFILWNKPTISQSVKDYEKKMGIKIKSSRGL